MAWRNVISKNADRAKATKIALKLLRFEKTPFYVVCRLHVLREGNDKCKLIAWFVLLFDSEMMSRVVWNFCCRHCSVMYAVSRIILFSLKEVLHVNSMWLSSAVAFFSSHITDTFQYFFWLSNSGKIGLLKQSRPGRDGILISSIRQVFQLIAILSFAKFLLIFRHALSACCIVT